LQRRGRLILRIHIDPLFQEPGNYCLAPVLDGIEEEFVVQLGAQSGQQMGSGYVAAV
jgi:hypothetical protein